MHFSVSLSSSDDNDEFDFDDEDDDGEEELADDDDGDSDAAADDEDDDGEDDLAAFFVDCCLAFFFVTFSSFFSFSSPLCLCHYHPQHPVFSHTSSSQHYSLCAPFLVSPFGPLSLIPSIVPSTISSFFFHQSTPPLVHLLLLLLLLSVGSGGSVNRSGGCGRGVHEGISFGVRHGGCDSGTFSIFKLSIMSST